MHAASDARGRVFGLRGVTRKRARQVYEFPLDAGELADVLASMARLAAAGDGWINLVPQLAGEDENPTSLRFSTLFGGGNSGITMCTWIPGRHEQHGGKPSTLGIAHVTGRRAVAQLAASGVVVPKAWFVEQDHLRRGLVVRLPPDELNEEVLSWSLRALRALSAPRQVRGWRADVYLPTQS